MSVRVVFDPSWLGDAEYRFVDSNGVFYFLEFGNQSKPTSGMTPAFFDGFHSCKRIVVDFTIVNKRRVITKIISYK